MSLKENEFYDINKFPTEEGILLFPISMSRISNSQNAEIYFSYIQDFTKKIIKPLVGANIIYGDQLYFYSDEKSNILKKRYSQLIFNHRNNFLSILKKNPFYIVKSFSFTTWSQQTFECVDFANDLDKLRKIYDDDKQFQDYVQKDAVKIDKKISENTINFFLEESLLFYFITKGCVRLRNDYVQDAQKWILNCYPGKPLYTEIYLHQKNFFQLENVQNKYQNCFYDLEEKKLYDYDRVNLETISL